eukprot:5254774-Pleurochrysis_carterae.AAC.1
MPTLTHTSADARAAVMCVAGGAAAELASAFSAALAQVDAPTVEATPNWIHWTLTRIALQPVG